jgi:hypothetical protein
MAAVESLSLNRVSSPLRRKALGWSTFGVASALALFAWTLLDGIIDPRDLGLVGAVAFLVVGCALIGCLGTGAIMASRRWWQCGGLGDRALSVAALAAGITAMGFLLSVGTEEGIASAFLWGAIMLLVFASPALVAIAVRNGRKRERLAREREFEERAARERDRRWRLRLEVARQEGDERRRQAREARAREDARRGRIDALLDRDDPLRAVRGMAGHDFERFVAALFRKQGYRVRETPGSGDQGVDLLVEEGGHLVAVQLKRHSNPVGNKAVQEVLAGMAFYGARDARVITTSSFTPSARELAGRIGVQLVDGRELAEWMSSLADEPWVNDGNVEANWS